MSEFMKILKSNPYHGPDGRFSSKQSSSSASAKSSWKAALATRAKNAEKLGLKGPKEFKNSTEIRKHLDDSAKLAVKKNMDKDDFLGAVGSKGHSFSHTDHASARYDFHRKSQKASIEELTRHRGNSMYLD